MFRNPAQNRVMQKTTDEERIQALRTQRQTLNVQKSSLDKTKTCFELCVLQPESARFEPKDKKCFTNCISSLFDSMQLVVSVISQEK